MPSENCPLFNGYFKINVQLFMSYDSVPFLESSRKSSDANPDSYQMDTGGYRIFPVLNEPTREANQSHPYSDDLLLQL